MREACATFRLLTFGDKISVMRKIDSIIVHCSATKAGQDFSAADIDCWHRERGFNGIGYHYVIRLNGTIEKGRNVARSGAHCKGWNERSIGICYIGGLDANGLPADTRTDAQKRILYQLIMELQREYGILCVLGHRDTSPDLNGDGMIEPYEYMKACPCFDVKEFLRIGRAPLFIFLLSLMVPVLFSGCRSGKELVDRSCVIEADSNMEVIHGKVTAEQSCTSGNAQEMEVEHVEQILAILKPDSSFVIEKTTIERKFIKEKSGYQEKQLGVIDSLEINKEMRYYSKKNEKEVAVKKNVGRNLFLLFIGVVVIGGLYYIGNRHH